MHPIAYDKVMQDQKQYAPSNTTPRKLLIRQAFEKDTALARHHYNGINSPKVFAISLLRILIQLQQSMI